LPLYLACDTIILQDRKVGGKVDNLFKDLESMGISGVENINLFVDESKKEKSKVVKKTIKTNDIVYERSVSCPVCNKSFKTTSIRSGRIRFVDTELDLRPVYSGFDPIPYDVVVCNHCGYAGLNKYFQRVSEFKAKKIKAKISANYKGKVYPKVLSYEEAIERYKLALFNSVVGNDTNGTKAYLCLKISWLYRGWKLQLKEEESEDKDLFKALMVQELTFVRNAFEGFLIAYENETFPIMSIDQGSMEYLIAELARRQGKFDESKKWLSRVIQRQSTNKRLHNKIFEVKELINKEVTT